jgi:dTDP-4-dehydrorhamnose 3,5-epimerase
VKFTPTPIPGAVVIDLEPIADDRGFFARTWCADELEAHGLSSRVVQCSVSYNRRKGTLRGMHFQTAPHEEVKIVRCVRGSIRDVIVDVRPASPAFKRWFGVDLSAANGRALYVPAGVAHGFQTLEDDSEVAYQISERHHQESARGVRWDDPAFGIAWPPAEARIIHPRDLGYADFAG